MPCGRKLLTTFLFLAILLARIPRADAIPCQFIIVERRSIEANDDGHQRTLESEGDNDSSGLMRRASKEIDRHLIAGAWSATLALGSAALSVTSNAIKMNDAQKYGDKTKSGAKAAAKERPRQNERGSTASGRQKEHSCLDERRPDDFALRHGHHHHESPTSALCSADSDSESDSDDGPSLPHSHRRFEKRAARHSSAIYDSDNSKDQIISDVLIRRNLRQNKSLRAILGGIEDYGKSFAATGALTAAIMMTTTTVKGHKKLKAQDAEA
ncbi:hypothetical protein FA10DRAFT_170301 [Acaromyces ingoldii]|uniref:HIG1 domain-containing protein n=1 Tax=Acaromyces ingoldii TaxID=215250 RepID=A0A316YKT5_9BASI|nr:hypothetical protein FA10DRAFT_170301 [Acaromyces ingoldii]PWN88663.1 hypothetical protein FA10DRAFT_170301 [Acaromyces ingoldii]